MLLIFNGIKNLDKNFRFEYFYVLEFQSRFKTLLALVLGSDEPYTHTKLNECRSGLIWSALLKIIMEIGRRLYCHKGLYCHKPAPLAD